MVANSYKNELHGW